MTVNKYLFLTQYLLIHTNFYSQRKQLFRKHLEERPSTDWKINSFKIVFFSKLTGNSWKMISFVHLLPLDRNSVTCFTNSCFFSLTVNPNMITNTSPKTKFTDKLGLLLFNLVFQSLTGLFFAPSSNNSNEKREEVWWGRFFTFNRFFQ